MKIAVKIVIVMSVLSNVFCSNDTTHQFETTIKENGVTIYTISGPPKYTGSPFILEETLSLGGADEETELYKPDYEFLVDENGNMYFTDESRVKKFSKDGEFVGFLTRQGQGPGEAMQPKLHTIFGDTLFVNPNRYQGGLSVLEVINTKGEFIKRITLPKISNHLIEGGRSRYIHYLGNSRMMYKTEKSQEKIDRIIKEIQYGVTDLNGNHIRTLDIKYGPHFCQVFYREGSSITGRFLPFMLWKTPVSTRYGLKMLDHRGSELQLFDDSFKVNRSIIFNMPHPEVSHDEVSAFLEKFTRPDSKLKLKRSHFPKTRPVTAGVVADDAGRLWMRKGDDYVMSRGQYENTYMIISKEGEYLADLEFPIDLKCVLDGFAYGFTSSEDYVLSFKRYKLIERTLQQ